MNLKKNIINLVKYPLLSIKLFIKILKDIFLKKVVEKNSKNFFENNNMIKYFISGAEKEVCPDYIDLKNLYGLIRERKPKCVVEFGSGFSTIAITLALKENKLKDNVSGRLFSVDGNEDWIKNTEKKINSELKKFVKFHYSKPIIARYNGQIVSLHDNLPDVSPNFIYLDGPSPLDVVGEKHGLSFKSNSRRIVAADPLLYESTAPADFFILVDRRYTNSNFLEKNLIYDYKVVKKIHFGGFVTFEKKYQPYP